MMKPNTLIAFPYRVARAPLALVESRLAQRLPQDSRWRLLAGRAIGNADQLAGRVLRNESLTDSGADRLKRADLVTTAVDLEEQAGVQRRSAKVKATLARNKAAVQREVAEDKQAAVVTDAVQTEISEKQAAVVSARTRSAQARKSVEERTDQRLSAIRQDAQRTEAAAEARVRQADHKAKAEFDEARNQRAAAQAKRSDADNLAELVDAKQKARKSS